MSDQTPIFDLDLDDDDFSLTPDPPNDRLRAVMSGPGFEAPATETELTAIAAEVVAEAQAIASLPIVATLPGDFPLSKLLTFIPDVALKRRIESIAADAETAVVTGPDGLAAADTIAGQLRESLSIATMAFDGSDDLPGPTKLAYAFWKRMTGLRGDFTGRGEKALDLLNKRIVAEDRRLKAVEAEQRSKDQEKANEAVRAQVAKAAEDAKKNHAPAPIVAALEKSVTTATAPPVAGSFRAPSMANTSVVPKWRCRLKGTPAESEANPKMDTLTPDQQARAREVLQAILDGEAPLTFVEFNWGKMNKRADADKTTFAIPGLEAYDEGGTRSKGRK